MSKNPIQKDPRPNRESNPSSPRMVLLNICALLLQLIGTPPMSKLINLQGSACIDPCKQCTSPHLATEGTKLRYWFQYLPNKLLAEVISHAARYHSTVYCPSLFQKHNCKPNGPHGQAIGQTMINHMVVVI